MSHRTGISRRLFLKVALGATAGLAIGVQLPVESGEARRLLEAAREDGAFVPNAWIRVSSDDRITFVVDQVEMGQGVATGLATLAAEELGVEPMALNIEFAPANILYVNKEVFMQMTGGSTSIKAGFDKILQAAALARTLLVEAASRVWDVPVGELSVDGGAVIHSATDRTLRYGALASLAAEAGTKALGEVRLKDPKQWRHIGAEGAERVDLRSKVDGSASFGLDLTVPNMAVAVVIRPPMQGGALRSFDGSAAEDQPGILSVVEIPQGVAVVATSYWRARKAAGLVEVEWDGGEFADLSSEGLSEIYKAAAEQEGQTVLERGMDPLEGLDEAVKTIDAVYTCPHLAHAAMEPLSAVAHVTSERCDVWAGTQAPALAVEQILEVTDLPREAIHVRNAYMGGGFGRRVTQDFLLEAVEVSRAVDRPVKVVWSREDDMMHSTFRPATYSKISGMLDGEGRPIGWSHTVVGEGPLGAQMDEYVLEMAPRFIPNGLVRRSGRRAKSLFVRGVIEDETAVEGADDIPYDIPNIRVSWVPGIPTAIRPRMWRSVGHSWSAFVVESFIDELAHAAGSDPLAFRRAHLIGHPRQLAVLERAAKQARWGEPLPSGRYQGIAQHKSFNSYCAWVVELSMEGDVPRVHRMVGAIDCGIVINPDIVRAQMESGAIFGLSAALKQKITFVNGQVQQTNFHQYDALRMSETPEIEVHLMDSTEPPTGVGEPVFPPVAPALCNAIFAASGRRVRALPVVG